MRKSRGITLPEAPSIALVVDGEDEIWYFNMLKRNERQIRINIKPEIPSRKSLDDQYAMVLDLLNKEFSHVFWIVDLDVILKEERENRIPGESPMRRFIRYRRELLTEHSNVCVIVNNPCIEFWFYLHFKNKGRLFTTCDSAIDELKKALPGYEKSQKYFTKQGQDIYLRLKPQLKDAIRNSQRLGPFDPFEHDRAKCEMNSFFMSEPLRGYFE